VLIDKAGRPKISDFGIARGKGDEQLTQVGFLTGTPGYLSPELARGGDPHSASDVWALGATLYSAVEGRAPFEPRSNPIALLQTIATQRPRPMTHAGAVGPAIHEMMLEDPARRWDMATSAQRLGRIARVEPTAVMPRVVPPRSSVSSRVDPVETAAMPKVDPAPTVAARYVEPTRRLEAGAPVVALAADRRPEPPGPRMLLAGPTKPPVAPGRGQRWRPLALVTLLVVAFGAAYLWSPLGDNRGATTVSTTRVTKPTGTRPSATGSPNVSKASGSPSTISAASRDLESFVASYYSDVTKERDRTWHLLTPGMQKAAGGRHGYDGFWRTIDRVKVNQDRANASTRSAVVNLTFTRKDGTTSTETHRLSFETGARGYLIGSDQLLG
jgi:eukaryotic-like serine/threonine-protein kinase